jgi:glucokinase
MTQRRIIAKSQAKPPFFVGIDLGGTNIKVGVIDDVGETLSYHTAKTLVERGPEDGAKRIAEAALEAIRLAGLTPSEIARVGLGSPGTMDIPGRRLLQPANFPGWYYFPLPDRVAHYAQMEVTFANDATAAAYGEFWVGPGKDLPSMILLTLGTGIGCGIIIGDLLLDGEHSHGGEYGHTIIFCEKTNRQCGCGRFGHFEAYASATAVAKRTQEALDAGRASSISVRLAKGEELDAKLVGEEAACGDELALEIVMETARYLGIGAVNLMHTIDPAGILFGGAMTFGGNETDLGRRFLARIKEEIHLQAYKYVAERTMIDYATLGGDAGYIGAGGIARLDFQKLGRK